MCRMRGNGGESERKFELGSPRDGLVGGIAQ